MQTNPKTGLVPPNIESVLRMYEAQTQAALMREQPEPPPQKIRTPGLALLGIPAESGSESGISIGIDSSLYNIATGIKKSIRICMIVGLDDGSILGIHLHT